MNYIIVGKNGRPSMTQLFDWIIEDDGDFSLIRQLSGKEKKMKGEEYSITDPKGNVKFTSNIVLTKNDTLIRWGSRANINEGEAKVINTNEALNKCSNKALFRQEMVSNYIRVPFSVLLESQLSGLYWKDGVVLRPDKHRAGKDFFLVNTPAAALKVIKTKLKGRRWYASEYIDKVAEYRVQYAFGKVISIKSKPKPNAKAPEKGPWNFSVNEDEWEYIPWGDYNIGIVKECILAAKAINIDVCAFDVMLDKYGEVYILEANTAPTLSPYTINRYAHLFIGIVNGTIDYKENYNIDSDNPKDYVWKNKNLNIKK